ncbi:MAG: antiviral reverse transcriptase Drt2 [Panacagrimonas sp.]
MHFDEPSKPGTLQKAVGDALIVQHWQFLPLLQAPVVSRKVKRDLSGDLKTTTKIRPICYAGHADAALYEYYSRILSARYEEYLGKSTFSDSVTAFRSGLGKCNIHFAADAFAEIRARDACTALAFDIQSFFDSLDHTLLKAMWCKVLGVLKLPSDHFKIFRSVTQYAFVDRDKIYQRFKISKHNPRANARRRICSISDLRDVVRAEGFIERNLSSAGIPQGLPISAVLSNIYLLDFDAAISSACKTIEATYFRYCDDILIIAPVSAGPDAGKVVTSEIANALLTIQSAKSSVHQFVAGTKVIGKPLQYLGFTYDGRTTLLRNAGITRYYSRMRAAVRLADKTRKAADSASMVKTKIKTKKVFKKYTYLGRQNYLSYVFRSSAVLQDEAIKWQMKPHWKKVKAEVKKKEDAY